MVKDNTCMLTCYWDGGEWHILPKMTKHVYPADNIELSFNIVSNDKTRKVKWELTVLAWGCIANFTKLRSTPNTTLLTFCLLCLHCSHAQVWSCDWISWCKRSSEVVRAQLTEGANRNCLAHDFTWEYWFLVIPSQWTDIFNRLNAVLQKNKKAFHFVFNDVVFRPGYLTTRTLSATC